MLDCLPVKDRRANRDREGGVLMASHADTPPSLHHRSALYRSYGCIELLFDIVRGVSLNPYAFRSGNLGIFLQVKGQIPSTAPASDG